MAFTAKARVSVEDLGNGNSSLRFFANYADADGNRINDDWAEATPIFTMNMTVKNSVVVDNSIASGQEYTLMFSKDI